MTEQLRCAGTDLEKEHTPFSNWLRTRKEIDSYLGYRACDVDFFWGFERGCIVVTKHMFLEEKRWLGEPRPFQWRIIERMHEIHLPHTDYYGYHLIQFENTSPEDGLIFVDRMETSKDDFIKFLQFKDVSKHAFADLKNRKLASIQMSEKRSKDIVLYNEKQEEEEEPWLDEDEKK